ncbi:hypothetical protein [Streptomyces sp. NPDC059786]|uniref:hypothetical protein n=1 Tax=Streptomyces sp. NPDC059786 TaxID=3346946 RepID=UPI003649C9CF
MPTHDMSTIVHVAGRDEALRHAVEDLKLGQWRAAQELLGDVSSHGWAVYTVRTQVMGLVAAGSRAVDAWCEEEPDDPHALVMRARVLAQRALNAHRAGAGVDAVSAAMHTVWGACADVSARWPACPVPWLCRLSLAQLDSDARFPYAMTHWAASNDPMLPPGPWPLLREVNRRDCGNREAYHLTLAVFKARARGALDFALITADAASQGSALRVLPLYQHVETYRLRSRHGHEAALSLFWKQPDTVRAIDHALNGWFAHHTDPAATCSLLDLNYLAYALTETSPEWSQGAADVFEAIGPYATPAPWKHVSHSDRPWLIDFESARRRARSAGRRR